jgi:hypothetical protein
LIQEENFIRRNRGQDHKRKDGHPLKENKKLENHNKRAFVSLMNVS